MAEATESKILTFAPITRPHDVAPGITPPTEAGQLFKSAASHMTKIITHQVETFGSNLSLT